MMEALTGGRKLSSRARQIARSKEEMLGLLADFPDGAGGDSDHELSFSDLVEATTSKASRAPTVPQPEQQDCVSALPSEMQRQEETEASQQQQQAAARERRLRRRRSDSRGSSGGGADGVLLNFYVPGLRLTRSMTAPRQARGTLPAGPGQGAPATVGAGKTRIQAPQAVGCWTVLWGRGRDRRNKPV